MPDMAAGGRAEKEIFGLPPRPGEDVKLHLGEWDSDLDSMTKEI